MIKKYPQLNEKKLAHRIKSSVKYISGLLEDIALARSAVVQELAELSKDTKVPRGVLRKIAKAYYNQDLVDDFQSLKSLQIAYDQVFLKRDDTIPGK